jgi:aminoglycoside phosphotransferase (APT) family kinase protein
MNGMVRGVWEGVRVADWEAVAAGATPLAGGYGGETFAVTAAGEDAVLKLYGRDPGRAVVDVALVRLVRGLLPVPRVLDARTEASADGPPYVLFERLPGVNGQLFLDGADEHGRRRFGAELGGLLVRLGGMPFLPRGDFAGAELAVEPFPPGDLHQWFERYADRLGFDDRIAGRLAGVLDQAEDLAAETGRVCLVHSDFNPKNLLADPDTGAVTGLVDWEFAHAGSPYADLGNLLRFDDDPVLAGAVLEVVRRDGAGLAEPVMRRGRAADLWALIDLAARAGQNPVATAARELLLRTAESGDLDAGRPAWEIRRA